MGSTSVGMDVEGGIWVGQDLLQEKFEWGPEHLPGMTKGNRKGRVFQQREQHVARAGFVHLRTVDT